MATTRSAAPRVDVPPADRPALSIVVVTYATGEIVERCLESVAAHTPEPYEVIVVDNAAPGGLPTADRLRLTTRGVRLVVSPVNLGFGGGNEVGVALSRAPVICLMNPDVIVRPGWLPPLLNAVADPTVGIVAPVLLEPDGAVQEAGQRVDGRAITKPLMADPGDATIEVDYSSAACWVMRADVHERAGGFDPAYHPAYFEDVDLAWRVRRLGLRNVVVGASRVTHHRGSSTRTTAPPALAQQDVFRRRWAPDLATIGATP